MDNPIPESEISTAWPRLLRRFEEADPRFLPLLRRIADPDRLGGFAARWSKILDEVDLGLRSVEALRLESFSPELVRFVRVTILSNAARESRRKPGIVSAIVARVGSHPGEAVELLPLSAAALRSSRGPEFRSGLAGLVRLAATYPGLRPTIAAGFPESIMGRRSRAPASCRESADARLLLIPITLGTSPEPTTGCA